MKTIRQIYESLVMALQSITINKLRTFLSLLGITIGIFSIISVFTLIDSMERNIRKSIDAFGSNIIYIEKWQWSAEADYPWWKYVNRPQATFSEYQEIPQLMPNALAAFVISTTRTVQHEKDYINNITVMGATYEYKDMRKTDIARGRYFTPLESNSGANIAIIGNKVAEELFLGEDPVGRTIKIDGKKLEVIGVFAKEGDNMFGMSWDSQILVPLAFVKNIVNLRWAQTFISVRSTTDDVDMEEFKEELTSVMRRLRRLSPQTENNFGVNEVSILSNFINSIFMTINLVGGIIGMFAILVGGFGVANIMFVSVRERTAQIGIQKALGAKPYIIMTQFIFEAVLLSIVGGIIGLILIFIGTEIVSRMTEFTVVLTLKNILVGLGISSAVGAVSGIFPAYAAATMEPVKAIYKT